MCALLALCGPALAADPSHNLCWTVSNSQTAATGVTYDFSFVTGRSQNISSIAFSVPRGTVGHCEVGTVYGLGAGTATLAGHELTYRLTHVAAVPAATHIAVSVTGLANTRLAGSYATTVTTYDSFEAVETQTSQPIALEYTTTTVSVTVVRTLTVTGAEAGPIVQSNGTTGCTVTTERSTAPDASMVSVVAPPQMHTCGQLAKGQRARFTTYVVTPNY